MPILLSQTYEKITPESAEIGEAAEHGFDWEDRPHSFRELVQLIIDGGFIHPDCSHGVPRWLSTDAELDYGSCDYEIKSLHPGRDARSQRYWAKACRVVGINRGSL